MTRPWDHDFFVPKQALPWAGLPVTCADGPQAFGFVHRYSSALPRS